MLRCAQCVLVCLAAIGWLGEPAVAQSGAEIKEWHFIGNDAFSDKELRRLVKAHHISRLSKLFAGDDPMVYDSETVADDLDFLVRHYQREGFLSVKLAPPRIVYDKRKDVAEITVSIAEGPPVKIRKISHEITNVNQQEQGRLLKFIERRLDRMSLQPEERFRDTSVLIDQDTLRRIFSYHGYPHSRPEYQLKMDTVNWTVDINWLIKPGPLAVFDTVSVDGNQRVSAEMIGKAIAFKHGQEYDQRLVEQTQQQIYGLGMFDVVTAHPLLGDPPLSRVSVDVNVREMPRYRAKVGAGYGREDKFRTFLDLRKNGFLGQIRQLRLYARYSDLEPYHIRLTFTQPAFIYPRTVLTVVPFIRRQEEKAFSLRRLGSEAGVSNVFSRYLTGSANYIYEAVKFVGDSVPVSVRLEDTSITSYRKSSVVFSGQFNNSAPLLAPNHGVFSASTATVSGLGLGSDFHFWKIVSEVRKYQEVGPVVLAGRFKLGGIDPLGGDQFVPLEERLFSGGSQSVRGWARQELGPKINGVPIGGKSQIEGSAELRFPIYGMFSGAVFMDFGNVWLTPFAYHIDDLRYAVGLGVRVSTPVGPVRLDVARPVWDEETKIQLHINIGQAF